MKRILFIFGILVAAAICAPSASAQVQSGTSIGNAAPTGNCYSGNVEYVDFVSGKFYICKISGTTGVWTEVTGSGSMTWPAGAGIAVYSGSDSWSTSLAAPTGDIVGTSDSQALTNKDMSGAGNTWPTFNQNTSGNAATATALASDPSDCAANQYATAIAASGNLTCSAVPLTALATQAADSVVMNATGGAAAPTAKAMPTGGTNGCAGTSDALTYNTTTHALGCNAITGGGPGTGTQYAPAYWATTSTLGSATPGTTNGDYILTEHVTGGAAVAPTLVQAGLGGRAITGATSTDAPTYADNETCVVHDQAASAGVTYTLPTTTTLGNTNFVLCIQNHSANTDTLKATTFTIQSGKTAAVAGATGISIPAGSSLRVKVDPNLSTQWLVDFNSTGSPVWQGCGSRGLGDGLNAIAAGTYLQFACVNDTGVTVTITGIHCWTDNAGTSTLNAANNAATALLTGAVTCNNTKASGGASGTQSGTTTLANGDAISFTFVADGTSKQTNWTVSGTY